MTGSLRDRWPIVLIALIALAAALKLAQPIAAPLTLAFVTGMTLSPINAWLRRRGLHAAPAAALTLIGSGALLLVGALLLRPWLAEAVGAWPQLRFDLQRALISLRHSLDALFDVQREVIAAIDPQGDGANGGGGGDMPSLADAAWLAPQLLAQLVVFVAGLFFFLLGKDDLYLRLTRVSGLGRAGLWQEAEGWVARYFGTVGLINFGFGLCVALALSLIGVPGAPIWGFLAMLANFVVYVGPAMIAVALLLAGVVTSTGFASVLPALTFVGLNAIEGQFVTPMILGSTMRQNPLLVFMSLAFWLWLWGPIGGIVAIPLLLWVLALRPPTEAGDRPGPDRPGPDQPGPEQPRPNQPDLPMEPSKSTTETSRPAGSKGAGENTS